MKEKERMKSCRRICQKAWQEDNMIETKTPRGQIESLIEEEKGVRLIDAAETSKRFAKW